MALKFLGNLYGIAEFVRDKQWNSSSASDFVNRKCDKPFFDESGDSGETLLILMRIIVFTADILSAGICYQLMSYNLKIRLGHGFSSLEH